MGESHNRETKRSQDLGRAAGHLHYKGPHRQDEGGCQWDS
jgi:hypothetical protein